VGSAAVSQPSAEDSRLCSAANRGGFILDMPTMLGSAVAGAISMTCNVQFLVPHGGIFAALIPGAVTNLVPYLGAIVAGTFVTTVALFFLKRPLDVPNESLAAAH
jgi:fructose-specific phosphotransferase system IIC component